jgi:hypothetical protein
MGKKKGYFCIINWGKLKLFFKNHGKNATILSDGKKKDHSHAIIKDIYERDEFNQLNEINKTRYEAEFNKLDFIIFHYGLS